MTDDVCALLVRLDAAENEQKRVHALVEESNREAARLRNQVDALKESHRVATAQLADANKDIVALREQKTMLVARVDQLTKNNAALETKCSRLAELNTHEHANTKKENVRLVIENKQCETHNERLAKLVETLSHDNDALHEILVEANDRTTKANKELEEHTALKEENVKLQARVADTQLLRSTLIATCEFIAHEVRTQLADEAPPALATDTMVSVMHDSHTGKAGISAFTFDVRATFPPDSAFSASTPPPASAAAAQEK